MGLDFDLDGVDDEQIGRLLEFLARSDVVECEIEQGESRLSVRRRVREGANPEGAPSPPSGEERAQEEPPVVRAPAVGIFYRSERRLGPPAVEVGARVRVGTVLGCIEVMTIPHGVFSTQEGVVESFLVEDGQAVEYGQPLITLVP